MKNKSNLFTTLCYIIYAFLIFGLVMSFIFWSLADRLDVVQFCEDKGMTYNSEQTSGCMNMMAFYGIECKLSCIGAKSYIFKPLSGG